ncbi:MULTISPECIES: hypothetical protein [unclassified Microcoleus]
MFSIAKTNAVIPAEWEHINDRKNRVLGGRSGLAQAQGEEKPN